MKLFRRWLGRESKRESAAENDASFNWLGTDQSFGTISDALSGTDDERSFTDTVPLPTLATTDDATHTVEENAVKDSGEEIDDDTVPSRTLSMDEDSTDEYEVIDSCSLDEDSTDEFEVIDSCSMDADSTDEYERFDPYNTGRFNTAKS